MSSSNDFVDYVIEQLRPFARVTSRRMFGGYGLYADGLFFALIAYDELYLKVDDSNRAEFEQRGCKPFAPFPDRPVSLSYYNVPADVLDDSDELVRWARAAFSVALMASKAKESKAKRVAKKNTKSVVKKVVKKTVSKKLSHKRK
jgi:DNA transformation protein and related proteins